MTEEKKKQYFYMNIGYIGGLFILISQLRYLLVSEDSLGQFLALIGILCLGSFIRYVESKLFPKTKEKRIIKAIYLCMLIIIAIIGSFLLLK
ncbi:hypothetical protein SAMN05216232_2168 [Virgibacillus subterraneus]|uniref:DUF4181 domain-containing protein n=1 Tax=Virgibacillus subterraneus TaxID=621109 RepID=A0A1H9FE89_9BACI|nr:hypothetical protein [Virgibacillus subterraneus]SEQ36222.1 hypothetical protein SAMN05216232_2168 [Virgibacillus subterraneus]